MKHSDYEMDSLQSELSDIDQEMAMAEAEVAQLRRRAPRALRALQRLRGIRNTFRRVGRGISSLARTQRGWAQQGTYGTVQGFTGDTSTFPAISNTGTTGVAVARPQEAIRGARLVVTSVDSALAAPGLTYLTSIFAGNTPMLASSDPVPIDTFRPDAVSVKFMWPELIAGQRITLNFVRSVAPGQGEDVFLGAALVTEGNR